MFTFRFQSLLQLALSRRDVAGASLAESIQAFQHLQQQREKLAVQRQAVTGQDTSPRVGILRADQLRARASYHHQLAEQDARLLAAMQQSEAEIAGRRETLMLAAREVRKLELLKQRDQDTWTAQQSKSEQAIWDEIAARR